jgi:UDP-N-acetylmuramoyl-L-alanyl-D-glutamate--2,6-diaminopimelate ligase
MLGTIEYDLIDRRYPAPLTTPGPIELAEHLVAARRAGARRAVMEVSSHSLCQKRTDGVTFAAAVFSNLTQDHLDYHTDMDDYLAAKRRLFEGLAPDAAAVVNIDDPASAGMVKGCAGRVVGFGFGDAAEVRGRIDRANRHGSVFLVEQGGTPFHVETPMVGRHNVANALAAIATALSQGVDPPTIARGLATLRFVPGRLQRVDAGEPDIDVFVDYAHTPDALTNMLSAVRPLTRGRLVCVFGCGGDRDRTKRPLMARAVAEAADAFVITSDNPRTEDPLAILADVERGLSVEQRGRAATQVDRRTAIRKAIERLDAGDVLVIAGKGHEDYQILGTEKIHFDDAEVARDALLERTARVS